MLPLSTCDPYLSYVAEGRDLLQRMLLPDPASRIQFEQIMVHPWFMTNLPPEAATMNDSYLRAAFPPGECERGFGNDDVWIGNNHLPICIIS